MTNNRRDRTTKSRKKNQNSQGKRNVKVLGNIGRRHHQTIGDEIKKIKNEYLRKTGKLFETKLYSRNLIKGIKKSWAVTFVRYSRPCRRGQGKNFNN